jgi:uncharacterized protein YggU (UPF0235/DUF167 family)
MSGGKPYRLEPGGLILHVRVTPNAGADRIDGPESRDDGTIVLRLRVRAVPDKGKANAAVMALLAKALGLPKSAVTLVAGDTARLKTLRLSGDPAALAAALDRLGAG